MDEILDIIKNLIKYKTQTINNDDIYECFIFIRNYFADSDFKCELCCFNNHYSMFISKNEKFHDLIFSGHIDVVPAQNEQFTATTTNGYLFGRGAIDMKSQVAVMMYVLKHYSGNKKVCMLITSDEEIGGFNGTPRLIDKYSIDGNVVIVPDGGYNFQLVNSGRGVLQLNINVKGKSVHSSCAYDGINAIIKAVELYDKIKLFVDNVGVDNQTINLAKISTQNDVYNKVPDNANMLIDIRYNANCPIKNVLQLLDGEENVSYSIYAQADPFYSPISNEYIRKYLNVSKDVLGRNIEVIDCPSASDARFFAKKGIPVIMMNPNGKDLHGINECIEISSIEKLMKIYNQFLEIL